MRFPANPFPVAVPTPDEINRKANAVYHTCRNCGVDHGLSWFRGGAWSVCKKQECQTATLLELADSNKLDCERPEPDDEE